MEKENKSQKISNKVSSKSSDKTKSSGGKAAIVVALRNKFFFMLYRYSSLVFITSLICFFSSLVFLIFFARQPVPPQYIAVNEDGTYIKLSPVSECKPDAEVQKFAMGAIKKLYKYDYINYADQIQEAAIYFTPQGWNEYLEEYGRSNVLAAVKEYKWIVSVQPEGIPSVVKNQIENGVCTWELKTPISVLYVGNNSQTQKGDLYMRISRYSVIKNPEGLGITKVIFSQKT